MKSIYLLLTFLLAISACIAQPTLSLTRVIKNLNIPMQLVNAGDGTGRIFIVQKAGKIQVYSKNYDSIGIFLTVTGIATNDERGLLSMAFHPDYENNGLFYVYYTNTGGNLELARYQVSVNANIADATSKVILKTIPHPINQNHNGGELHFGRDSCLYLSTGDGGSGGDPPNNAQTSSVLLGKILRFKVTTSNDSPYYDTTVTKAESPFGNEVFCMGLRNPFRWSFDRLTHDMWIGDVGQDSYEEINFRSADSIKGANYGWHCYEGNNTYNTTGCSAASNYIFPVHAYPTQNPSAAVTGGNVYRGPTYIDLNGYYIAADFFSGIFYKIKQDTITHTFTITTQTLSPAYLSDFGETEDGELYAAAFNDNSIYRVVSSGAINYIFNGDGNWEDANNWSNKTIPPLSLPTGSVITIDPIINGECVLNLNTIQTISAGARLNVMEGKKFRIISSLIIQ